MLSSVIPDKDASVFVRKVRGERTQDEFAEMLGVKREMVSRWETGGQQPGYEYVWMMLRIARAMGLDGDPDAAEELLLETYRKLPKERRDAIIVDLVREAAKVVDGKPVGPAKPAGHP